MFDFKKWFSFWNEKVAFHFLRARAQVRTISGCDNKKNSVDKADAAWQRSWLRIQSSQRTAMKSIALVVLAALATLSWASGKDLSLIQLYPTRLADWTSTQPFALVLFSPESLAQAHEHRNSLTPKKRKYSRINSA